MDSDDPKVISRHMFALISENSYQQVREMVDRYGLSFVPEWGNGYRLLFQALRHRRVSIAKMLLGKGAEVNALSDESSPLALAVRLEDAETIRMLLDKGAKVNIDFEEGSVKMPLFHLLLQNFERLDRDVHLVEHFLRHGADVNAVDSVGETALFHAVNMRSKHLVELFLKGGAKVNVYSHSRLTPLHVAVKKCSKEVVEMLLNAGAAVECRAADDATPLHLVCDRNMLSPGILELLLSKGADINSETADGRTPLHCAAAFGCKENVELLVDKGAAINATTLDFSTPLHYAVARMCANIPMMFRDEHAKISEILLERGADVNAQTKDGKTCLVIAVEKSSVDLVDVILRHKPDRSVNQTCVQVAVQRCGTNCHAYTCEREWSPIVEKLLEYGFSLRPQDIGGPPLVLFFSAVQNGFIKTAEAMLELTNARAALLSSNFENVMALHAAAQKRQLEMARLLLWWGADVNAVSRGRRPLDFAIENADVAMFQLLVSHQADVKYNRELLLHAAIGRVEIVEYLLQQGAYVNVRDRARNTALHHAVGKRSYRTSDVVAASVEEAIKIARLLLRFGAKVNVRNTSGETPLMAASDRGSCELASLLLDHHADVNMRDTNGRGSALDRAVKENNYELSKLLLERGARMNFRDERGERPLHVAVMMGNSGLVRLFLEYGVDENALSDKILSERSKMWHVHALFIAVRGNLTYIMRYLLESADCSLNSYMGIGEGGFRYEGEGGYRDAIDFAYRFRDKNPEAYPFLVRHIVKMKAANLYVNDSNSSYGHPWHKRHEISTLTLRVGLQDLTIAQFTELCKAEIAAMQNHKIQNTSLSFDSILRASTKKLVNLSGNEYLKKAVSSDSFLSEFPIYGSWIRGRLSIGERRRPWYEKGCEALGRILPSFPCDCIQYVLDYLPTEDIRMLILASQSEDKSDACPPLRYRWYLQTRKAWIQSLWPKAASRVPTQRKVEMHPICICMEEMKRKRKRKRERKLTVEQWEEPIDTCLVF